MTKLNLTAVLLAASLLSLVGNTANAQFKLQPVKLAPTQFYYFPPSPVDTDSDPIVKQAGPIKLYASGKLVIDGGKAHEDCRIILSSRNMLVVLESNSAATQWLSLRPGTVNLIEFNGGDGNDSFMIDGPEHMALGLHQFDCDLNGGYGLDYLEGGLGNDILDGGFDRSNDYLVGNEGSDVFVSYYWYDGFGFSSQDLGSDLNYEEGDEREWTNMTD